MITRFKRYNEEIDWNNIDLNDPTIQQLIANSKKEPKLKVGDILDIGDDHIKKGARHFEEVTGIMQPAGVAITKYIKCNRRPYLCNIEHDHNLRDLFDETQLADMEVFNAKMKPPTPRELPDDPYGEEIWEDDSDLYIEGEEEGNEYDYDRIIHVHVFDKRSADNYTGHIVFIHNADVMNRKIDDVIEESGFGRCYIECDSDDPFTEDELIFLDGLDINFS